MCRLEAAGVSSKRFKYSYEEIFKQRTVTKSMNEKGSDGLENV